MIFIKDNLLWFATALISGAMLLLPLFQRRGNTVSIVEATQLFNQGKTLFLDVREEADFAQAHVREARNIPLAQLGTKLAELAKFKKKTVVVICAKGNQSAKAVAQLHADGFETVHVLEGGLAAWQAQGMPVVK